MAATTAEMLQNHGKTRNEVSRKEIKAAIDKAVELRALHAALMQGKCNSPAAAPNLRYLSFSSSASPVTHHVSHFSAHDYPVFTPSYEDQPLPGYQQIQLDNQTVSEYWEEHRLGGEGNGDDQTNLSDYNKNSNASSRKGFPSEFAQDQKSFPGSFANNTTTALRKSSPSPGKDFYKSSRRNSLGDIKSVSSCNSGKPAISSSEETDNACKNSKNCDVVMPLTDLHSSLQSQQTKNRGLNLNLNLSWLFPRIKKKQHKNESSPSRAESEEVSQVFFKDLGIMSIEKLKKELVEANESRDAALTEAAEMKSSLGELKQKLEYLETYCEELRNALRQVVPERLGNLPKKGKLKSIDGIGDGEGEGENLMPVSEEVMVEGFLQIVSEARLSVKQFCKTLVSQIDETDDTLMESLNLLLKTYKLSLNSKHSKAVLYHLEAIINQSLYQDFENCVFEKNGSPKILDPRQDRQAQFSSFVALRNLSWNQVLRKGTKHYSEEFSRFCDQKMSCIVSALNWTRSWPEQLLQSFFVAAKCIWLLHLLAFSFNPPLGIMRIDENTRFDSQYMDDIFVDRQRSSLHGPSRVKIMVMPGFYVQDRVLRCKVLCRYKSVAL